MTIFVKHFGYGSSDVHKTPFAEYIAGMASPDPYDYPDVVEYVEERVEKLSGLVGILVELLYRQGTLGPRDIKALAEHMSPNCAFIAVEDV